MSDYRQFGCGDNSCVFGSPGGMATNGGCRCFEEMPRTPEGRTARLRLTRGVLALRQALQPRPKLEKVREFIQRALAMTLPDRMRPLGVAALAELDAAEAR